MTWHRLVVHGGRCYYDSIEHSEFQSSERALTRQNTRFSNRGQLEGEVAGEGERGVSLLCKEGGIIMIGGREK